MPSGVQGAFYFTGVRGLLSASYTFAHGISPGVCQMVVPPQPGKLPGSGTLSLVYGNSSITLPDSRLDKADVIYDPDGYEMWALTILDRRWRWRDTGTVDGFYNVRRRGGNQVVTGTLKSVRELAAMCLEAMDETGFNVNALPTQIYPEVAWETACPAIELARLCDDVGCRVTINGQNRVVIRKVGIGAKLPLGTPIEGSGTFDPPDGPDELCIACAPSRYQGEFPLEAVGEEPDGEIRPIDKLSYVPTVDGVKSWKVADVDQMMCLKDTGYRPLALASVFRWYRIKAPFSLPGFQHNPIESLDQVLPLLNHQVQKRTLHDGREEYRPPWVYGKYYDGSDSREPPEKDLSKDLEGKTKLIYRGAFSLDTETGIVKFSDPVYLEERAADGIAGFYVQPAQLFLRVACNARHAETRAFFHGERRRDVPNAAVGPHRKTRYVKKDDIVNEFFWKFPGGNLVHNTAECLAAADYYLEALLAEYQLADSQSLTWPGFLQIQLDGAIQQITWAVSEEGWATTRASRNKEEVLVTPTYKDRRLFEKLVEAAKAMGVTPGAAAEKLKRGKA